MRRLIIVEVLVNPADVAPVARSDGIAAALRHARRLASERRAEREREMPSWFTRTASANHHVATFADRSAFASAIRQLTEETNP